MRKKRSGFTLIELMIVLLVMVFIVGVLYPLLKMQCNQRGGQGSLPATTAHIA